MASISPEKPEILLLCLASQSYLDQQYDALFFHMGNGAHLKRAKTAGGAIKYLESNSPKVIIATDEGLALPKNKPVFDKIVPFVQNGGLLIVGLHFPTFIYLDKFGSFFGAFGLPWISSDYTRATFKFNAASKRPTELPMPAPYYMKALHVKNARPEEKIFVPVTEAETSSSVIPAAYLEKTQAAVVGAKVGEGYVAYVGDVNGSKESNTIILSLCGIESA
ncbi:hypothetical protein LSUE1_G003606 [Lachnellula suecica]|uniref:Uncharacterized protein n=1 Tax=Lachnellula suecica TaxID=602035 RepID=A0A8T9CDD7_9HELO|nr:hypothetical protein LSUE1_G003606 [Lachnellula suecica]